MTELHVALEVNGERREVDVEPRRLLVQVLREELGLTGTHVGCDTSQCGACTVHVDGRAVKSCTMLAAQAEGRAVTTIEGIGTASALHPLQQAWIDEQVPQCGFCQNGQIMAAKALLERNPSPSEDEVRIALSGNLCRCTGYDGIVKAVLSVAPAPPAT